MITKIQTIHTQNIVSTMVNFWEKNMTIFHLLLAKEEEGNIHMLTITIK